MLVLGRAAGVHFVFVTQSPDEVVMSAPLRCGFPGRIAFKVAFEEDSRMIIDENRAPDTPCNMNYRKPGACPKGNCRGYVRWVELG